MDRAEISFLLHMYRIGQVTEEEKIFLDGLILSDINIKKEWEELESTHFPDDVLHYIKGAEAVNNLEKLKARLVRRSRRNKVRRIMLISLASCIFLAVIVWEWSLISQYQPSTSPLAANKQVQLVMDNGSVIDLDSTVHHVGNGPQFWINNNKQLHVKGAQSDNFITWSTLRIPARRDYSIQLSDGSTVHLNSKSTLRFPSKFAAKREVYLEGEGFFTINTDDQHPFIVHTKNGDILVLGTSFNVNAYIKSGFTTSLLSGNVVVMTEGEKVSLKPGQEARFTIDRGLQIVPLDQGALLWREGIYHFNNTALEDLKDIIERTYDTALVIDNPRLQALQVNGKINREEPLAVFMTNISAASGGTCYIQDGTLHIK
jgi:ferric-dicitrate binding protein FerR (iron transport regulator)